MLKFSIFVLLLTHVVLVLGQTGKPRSIKPKLLPRKKGDLQAAAGHFQSYKGFPYHDSSFSNSIGYSHSQPAQYQSSGWCGSGFGGYQSGGGGGGYGAGFEGYSHSPPGWSSHGHDVGYSHGGSHGYGGPGWSAPVVSYGGHGHGSHGYESQGYMSHEPQPHYGHG